MDLQLDGLHVLVTGGSRGIGLACAELFLEEGARVSIVGRTPAHLEAARTRLEEKAPGRVNCFAADLQQAQAAAEVVAAVEESVGAIDVLVNSAGGARRTPFHELTPQAWHAAMDAKFFSYVHVTDPLLPRMAARGRGAVINVIGMGGKIANPTHLAGGAANAALMLMTAGLANAWGPRGVRVNGVNPGLTLTSRMAEGLAAEARLQGIPAEQVLAQATARMPLGRLATPQDIANVVVFLASPRSGYVSGAVVSVDGGATPTVV